MSGWLKLKRSQETDELLKRPEDFALYALIAMRARRNPDDPNPHNLKVGEALIGDLSATGTSNRTYRTTKDRLAKRGLATFRPTTLGTVATITSTSVFDINAEATDRPTDRPPTDGQPKTDQRPDKPPPTKKKSKKAKNEEVCASAGTHTDVPDWVSISQEKHPTKDAAACWPRYRHYCESKGIEPWQTGFEDWLATETRQVRKISSSARSSGPTEPAGWRDRFPDSQYAGEKWASIPTSTRELITRQMREAG